jgi:hypothetical protein
MLMKIFAPVVSLGALALAFETSALAACDVRVIGDAGANRVTWLSEASMLQKRFRLEWAMRDCASVEVRVESTGPGAWVAFAEREGSVARRHLGNAGELAPAVRALLVRVNPDYFARDDVPAEAPQEPTRRVDASGRLAYVLGGSLGVRLGVADGTAIRTPVLGGFAAFLGKGWELGVTGQWETSYRQAVVDQEPDWRASALAFGVIAGKRFSLDSWDLAAGISFSAAIVHGMSDDELPHTEASGADGRVGVYVGFIGSRTAPIRFRATFGADLVPRHAGVSTVSESAPANLPWWMGSFSLGIEAAP